MVATVHSEASLPQLKVDDDRLIAKVVDVTDEEQVKSVIDFTVQTFGKLDGIVNNAGVLKPGTILDASVEDFQKTFDVNVKGVFLGTKYAIPELLKAGGGSIVNFGSINSIGAEKLLTTYTASKGAVLTLTKAVALDFGAQGIRANTLCPGFVDTPLNVPHYTALGGRDELEAGLPDFQPIGRAHPPHRDRPLGRVPTLGSLHGHHRHCVRGRRRCPRRRLITPDVRWRPWSLGPPPHFHLTADVTHATMTKCRQLDEMRSTPMTSTSHDVTEHDSVDVLVIGAGPSGAVVTHTAATAGLNVLCLEQGDWVNPSDFPANHPEWELLIQHDWAHDPNVRALPSDYPVDIRDSDMWPVMFNAVGGSSIYYGAEWPRLLPSDFRVKTLDGVADDWPIAYDDLKPYHDEVDAFIGVSGVDGDTAYPDGLEYPLPPHPLGKPGMKAAEAANTLGWHWWPGTNAIPSQKNKTLEQCGRWGVCEWGCPQGAKASFDLIYMPQAQQAGAQVQTGARVRRIRTDDTGRQPVPSGSTATAPSTSNRRSRSYCAPTESAHPDCCCCRRTSATRTARQLLRAGRQEPDAAPELHRGRLLRGEPRELARPGRTADPLDAVLRHRHLPRFRPWCEVARAADPGTAEHHRDPPPARLRRAVGTGRPRRGTRVVERHPVGSQRRGSTRGTQPGHPLHGGVRLGRCPRRRSNTGSARTPARS